MRRLTLGLGLGALFALTVATSAQAVSTESTWTASGTGSPAGGTKSAPAAFSGTWSLSGKNNANPDFRAAVPSQWQWAWEGVRVRQQGVPVCTVEQVNDAHSVAGCPPGSHIGTSDPSKFRAEFGPIGLAEGPNTQCFGKTFDLYNGSAGSITMVIDGPPEQCATLGFLGAYPITLSTSGGKTTMTWDLPLNLQQPFPGAEGGLPLGSMVFGVVKAPSKKSKKKGKKAAKHFLLESINCKGPRDFTYSVTDPYGKHTINTTAGTCKAPKKKKKK
jgi:hypothetical protein